MAGVPAANRHVALIGFMGAGKSTLGAEVAARLGRRLVEVDREIERRHGTIPQVFEAHGEAAFRLIEAQQTIEALRSAPPAVISLGGGAVTSADVRSALAEHALTLLLDVDADTAWERVRGGDRPLARDELSFRALHRKRAPVYAEAADATVHDADGAVLAAGGIHLGPLELLGEHVPGPCALVADAHVLGIHGPAAQVALGAKLVSTHELPVGEEAKTIGSWERLLRELRLGRDGTIVALGGGCTTDAAGFAAATYLRGVRWVAVPTTLVGQVDAAIGGKTALNLPEGKNLLGAFHWPARTLLDPALLETLPERERRQGTAELVKTRLLAGRELDVRGAAAFKTAVCLRDPYEQGERAILNLGHTFAHALEAGSDHGITHGDAVALGLLAALRLSGRDTAPVERELAPEPVAADRERAWAALGRDKKRAGGEIVLVLLGDEGPYTAPVSEADVRRELDRLIAD